MEKVKRALLGDRKAQAELTKKGRKLPCHVCGKKAEIMFREGLFVIIVGKLLMKGVIPWEMITRN